MLPDRQQLVAAALVAGIVVSVAAFAGSAAGVETAVEGPDEVTKPDDFTLTSSIDIRDGERVPVENYTLTVRPAGAEEGLRITFAPNGTIVGTDPEGGVVGEGQIKVEQLRKKAGITPVDRNGSYGYGYGYGYDERTGDTTEFGYGYGYAGDGVQPTFTYDVELPSTAFKKGEYETFLTVNTGDETGLYQSNVQSFSVETRGDDRRKGGDDRGDRSRDDDRDDDRDGDDRKDDRDGDDREDDRDGDDRDDRDDESDDDRSDDRTDGTDDDASDEGNEDEGDDDAGEPGRDDPGRGR